MIRSLAEVDYDGEKLHKFEIACLMNFNFDNHDEAKKVIKSLNRFTDIQIDEILSRISDLIQ